MLYSVCFIRCFDIYLPQKVNRIIYNNQANNEHSAASADSNDTIV